MSTRCVPRLRTVSVGDRTQSEGHRVLAGGAQSEANAGSPGTES
jgi:hypothetical protein